MIIDEKYVWIRDSREDNLMPEMKTNYYMSYIAYPHMLFGPPEMNRGVRINFEL